MSSDTTIERLQCKLRADFGAFVIAALDDPEVTEVIVNPDGSVWTKAEGRMARAGSVTPIPRRSPPWPAWSKTVIIRGSPILGCEFPLGGERFEGMVPPIVTAPDRELNN